jgi:hypothetical protein
MRVDGLLYLVSAIYAAVYAIWPALPTHRTWGHAVAIPYAVVGLAACVLSSPRVGLTLRATKWCRSGLALIALVSVLIIPLGKEVSERAREGFIHHVRSEAIVVEEAARTLSHHQNPYAAVHNDGPLRSYPAATHIRFPYLPAMLVFGAARAELGNVSLADARVAFTVATLAIALLIAILWGRRGGRLRALQVLILLPTGALPLVTGGHDVPVLALVLLTLVLLRRGCPAGAGLALGLAATMRQIVWPLLPLVILAARHRDGRPARRRTAVTFFVPALVVNLPFFLWDPHAFIDDAIRFPLGLTDLASPAASPTLGRALAWSPAKLTWIGVILAAAAIVVFARRRHWLISPAAVAVAASALLTLAVVLAPSSRWGLLVYGLDLAAWAWLLRGGDSPEGAEGHPMAPSW